MSGNILLMKSGYTLLKTTYRKVRTNDLEEGRFDNTALFRRNIDAINPSLIVFHIANE